MAAIRTGVFALQSPLLAAMEEGFFADEGLEVTYVHTTSSREQLGHLIQGDIDVAQTAADNIIGLWVRRVGEAHIFHVADLGIDQFVVSGIGVDAWEDVRGRRVAVDAVDSGYAYVLYSLLRRNGLQRDEYEAVPIGGPLARLEQLRSGGCSVGLLNPHLTTLAQGCGLRVLARSADHFPDYPNLVFAVAARSASASPQLLAYSRAVDRAVCWAHDPANTGRAIELLMRARSCSEREATESYQFERSLRSAPCPTREQVIRSLEGVAALRERMGGGRGFLEEYFVPVTSSVS